ncbi:hypothetical protein PTKIN_Ptkin14bG0138200 [Pterospermum kingtungense]
MRKLKQEVKHAAKLTEALGRFLFEEEVLEVSSKDEERSWLKKNQKIPLVFPPKLPRRSVLANSDLEFNIVVPGKEIPEWFPHQSDESSIKMSLPRNIQNDSQWMGVTSCCIFDSAFSDDCWADVVCHAVIHGVNSRKFHPLSYGIEFKYRPKDHLSLRYWPRDLLYPSSSVEKCGETENLLITNLEDHECDEIFEYSIDCEGPVKVKKCGVRIVYEKDLEEMEETKEQFGSSSSANFDDDGSSRNGGALIKGKQNMYEVEKEGPRESDSAKERRTQKKL